MAVGRWLWAYFVGCLCATPILFVGGLLAFGAGEYLDGPDDGAVIGAVLVLLLVSLIVCMGLGALPTLVSHFALRGAERNDAPSYIAAGALLWGIMGLALGAIAEPSDSFGRLRDHGEVNLLGWTITSALSGGVALGLFWFLGVYQQASRRQPLTTGAHATYDTTLQLTPAQIYQPPPHLAVMPQSQAAPRYYEPPRREPPVPARLPAPADYEPPRQVPQETLPPEPVHTEPQHPEPQYRAPQPAPYVPVEPRRSEVAQPETAPAKPARKGFGFFSRREKKPKPPAHDPSIPFI